MWWCKGIRIKGLGSCGERMQLKIDTTVCSLMWGVWFARVVEEGVISGVTHTATCYPAHAFFSPSPPPPNCVYKSPCPVPLIYH